jgi:DNA-binding NarL/FixJ family response regulator
MKIILIDDHALIRAAMISALSGSRFEVVSQASSVNEGLAMINTHNPDLALVDINLGSATGIDLIKAAIKSGATCKFVVLTMHDDEQMLEQVKSAGASAFITKGSPIEQVIQLLNAVADGVNKFMKVGEIKVSSIKKDFALSRRESEVLSLLPTGATATAIGGLLFLTEATVKTHLASIYRKLGAANRAQAVSIALENKLITN